MWFCDVHIMYTVQFLTVPLLHTHTYSRILRMLLLITVLNRLWSWPTPIATVWPCMTTSRSTPMTLLSCKYVYELYGCLDNCVFVLFCVFFFLNISHFLSRAGDVIALINTASGDWWKGSVGDQKGYFPATYVQLVSRSDVIMRALYDYAPLDSGEIPLEEGQVGVVTSLTVAFVRAHDIIVTPLSNFRSVSYSIEKVFLYIVNLHNAVLSMW